MTAVADHAAAQSGTLVARDALGALNTLIAAGDRGVSGSDLLEAEAEVTVCERLEAGALARAQQEEADAEAAAKAAAVKALIAGYESTSGALTDAIEKTLSSLSDLLGAAQTHQSTTRSGLSAAGFNPISGAVPGHGRLQTPSPVEVIEGVQTLASKSFGLGSAVLHPHLLVEPIAAFLPVGTSVR